LTRFNPPGNARILKTKTRSATNAIFDHVGQLNWYPGADNRFTATSADDNSNRTAD
jgi:hypothetical protein